MTDKLPVHDRISYGQKDSAQRVQALEAPLCEEGLGTRKDTAQREVLFMETLQSPH